MLDLNKNIICKEGMIAFDNYYLYYRECENEFGIDYSIIDQSLTLVDGGIYTYGDFNEFTEMYDIDNGIEIVTLKELLNYVNEDSNDYNFSDKGREILNEKLKEVILNSID